MAVSNARLVGAGWLAFLVAGCATPGPTDTPPSPAPVRLSDLQFIGTHNSYHIAPDQAVFDRMKETGYRESARWTGAALEEALSFTHPPIRQQLDLGLRMFEFDLHDDPAGGRFADPGFLKALTPEIAASLAPIDPTGALQQPGLKVFHTADTDVRSQCLRFVQCLEDIRDWSAAHPGHMPIFIQLESKEGRKPILAGAYEPAEAAPFTDASWQRLHDEILSVFSPEQIFTPKDLRGEHTSVNAAVRAEGWPGAETLAGKVIFLLLDDPGPQTAYVELTENSLEPLLFVSRDAEDPHTGWLIRSTPRREQIRPLVEAGFLVYTRADAGSAEARRNDASRAREAIASGAQLISTDYPVPREEIGPYAVSFGGAYVRCNTTLRRDNCGLER